eukprot:s1599_g23.t1
MTKRTPEEAEIVLPQQVVFVVKKEEGAPGGWETRIKAYTDETIDDIKSTLRRNMDLEKEFLDEPGGEAHPLPRSGLKHRSQSADHGAL